MLNLTGRRAGVNWSSPFTLLLFLWTVLTKIQTLNASTSLTVCIYSRNRSQAISFIIINRAIRVSCRRATSILSTLIRPTYIKVDIDQIKYFMNQSAC